MTKCEDCANYVYNEEYECYICQINLDEDEMNKFLNDSYSDCSYYQSDEEYKIVRKQN